MSNGEKGSQEIKRANLPFSPINRGKLHERMLSDSDLNFQKNVQGDEDDD